MSAPRRNPLTRSVQFFTGKGGVGKSTVLASLATALARTGKRPLIVELGAHTSSSHLFRGPNVGYRPSEVAPGVFASRVEFEPALVDYITSRLKLRFVALLAAKNSSLRKLFLAAPGVDEIVTLHRVAELANSGEWDPVLVDLESTGHALMFFDLPGVLEVFLKDGPLRQVLDSATRLVRDGDRCAIHIVTVPEPLAVSETIELYEDLNRRRDLHLGYLFVNRVPVQWLEDAERQIIAQELDDAQAAQPWTRALLMAQYLAHRWDTAAKCLRGLRHNVDLPTIVLDAQEAEGAGLIESLADALTEKGLA